MEYNNALHNYCVYVCGVYIYIYIYIYMREREREREISAIW